MRRFDRGVAPDFLAANWEAWGQDWARRQAEGGRFHWRVVDQEPVNRKLLPDLRKPVQSHCSFCDNYPVCPPSIETIEHFRPKAQFPLEAYHWLNLYFCCAFCQRKEGEFCEEILRPDAPDYRFERYFRWDYTLGEVCVNERAAVEDQRRAKRTIEYFRLNLEHPSWRRREARRRAKDLESPLDDFAYRDFVELPAE